MRRAGETKMMRSDGYGRTRRYYPNNPRKPDDKRYIGELFPLTPSLLSTRKLRNLHFGRRPGVSRTDPSMRMPMHFGHPHHVSHHAQALSEDIVYRIHAAEEPPGYENSSSARSRPSVRSCIGYGTEIWPTHPAITFAQTHLAFGEISWSRFLEAGHSPVSRIEFCPRGISQRSPAPGPLRPGRKRLLEHRGNIVCFLDCRTMEPSSVGS